ncbi:hypothetical protein M569_09529 [Genlisea aurea]|uniref:Uncharacterized protein n=1 Tax=Genlisea aurea TaxID=192259 RepID=S8CE59_9LAMI|nr:hypothetical protein M569_09529 [Genlisea aurea]
METEENDAAVGREDDPVLCVNNCGYFGTTATKNMCSKCYKDFVARINLAVVQRIEASEVAGYPDPVATPDAEVVGSSEEEHPKKCGACRKRVGLTGFKCRCGGVFCPVHRFPDRHECGFDFRSAGQDAIARDNPVVKAEKLDKI